MTAESRRPPRTHEVRSPLCESECDVAAEAVPEHQLHAAPTRAFDDQSFEIIDVGGHRVGRPSGGRAAVPTPVVADHVVPVGEATTEPQHSGRTIHRTVDEHDGRVVGRSTRLRPDAGRADPGRPVGVCGHSTWTIRITSVAADVSINPR